jgi:tRNA A37 threonylcarbamoyladenosine modification protein TsaB
VPVAGVSTLDALESGATGALPVIDAGRREVFTKIAGEALALPPSALDVAGVTCVGDGALRYRTILEGLGALVPPDDRPEHVPHARLHAQLATGFGSAAAVEPVYVRPPDAKVPA